MADTEFFEIPADLPSGDAGVKIRALTRTVAGTPEKVGVTVIVDPTDPTIEADVDATYGLAADIKRLPATAPTAALQTTGNASLSSIDGKLPALGQALAAASVPVVLTAAQLSTLTPTAGLTDAQLRATAVPVSGTMKPSYGSSANNTITLHNLASDASFLAGAEGTEVDLSSYLGGAWISGQITVGTSPTANKEIRVYLVGKLNDSAWPDVFDGLASAETITSAGIRDSIARLVAVIAVDSTTSDRAYPFGPVWIPSVFGAAYPPKVVVPFVTHNTGVNTKNDAAAHFISFTKMNGTITT